MKNAIRASVLMTGAALVTMVATAAPVHAQHIHAQHPTSTHDGSWKRWIMIDNWTGPKEVVLDGQVTENLHTERFTNCTCEEVEIKVSESKKRTHKVSVNGSYTTGSSIEASAKALAGEVKATAHASVTIGGGYEWTNEVTYTIEQTTTNPKCTIKDYKETIEKYDAHGTMEAADHKVVCKNTSTGATANNYCNKQTITSKGTGFDGRNHIWQTVGPCTGYPCPCDEEPQCTGGDDCPNGETCTGGEGCSGKPTDTDNSDTGGSSGNEEPDQGTSGK